MNQIEVMRQALEALDDNQHLIAEHERHVYVVHYNRICEALRKAIEQAEQTGHRDFRVPDGWKAERIDEYEIRVVSAEGEAWRLRSADKNDMFNNFIFRWAEAMLSAAPTASAQQPLTDEQLDLLWREITLESLYDSTKRFARAIEAAHGIKGEKK